MFLHGVPRRRACLQPNSRTISATRFSSANRAARLENSAANGSDFASCVLASFFPDKTQNIVHFSLEFWIFTHYLVAAEQKED
jgi:hypothetical protein